MNVDKSHLPECDPCVLAWIRSRMIPWRRRCQLETREVLLEAHESLGYLHEVDFDAHMAAAGFDKFYPESLTGPYRARWLGVHRDTPIGLAQALARAASDPHAPTTGAELAAVASAMRRGYLPSAAGYLLWSRYVFEAGLVDVRVERYQVRAVAATECPFSAPMIAAAHASPWAAHLISADDAEIAFADLPRADRPKVAALLVRWTRPRLRLVHGGA